MIFTYTLRYPYENRDSLCKIVIPNGDPFSLNDYIGELLERGSVKYFFNGSDFGPLSNEALAAIRRQMFAERCGWALSSEEFVRIPPKDAMSMNLYSVDRGGCTVFETEYAENFVSHIVIPIFEARQTFPHLDERGGIYLVQKFAGRACVSSFVLESSCELARALRCSRLGSFVVNRHLLERSSSLNSSSFLSGHAIGAILGSNSDLFVLDLEEAIQALLGVDSLASGDRLLGYPGKFDACRFDIHTLLSLAEQIELGGYQGLVATIRIGAVVWFDFFDEYELSWRVGGHLDRIFSGFSAGCPAEYVF